MISLGQLLDTVSPGQLAPVFLFTGCLLFTSYFLSRGTEDATHAVWNIILVQLCGRRLGVLLPTPQFRIYSPPLLLPSSGDESMRTEAGTATVEVIPDFVILFITPILRGKARIPGHAQVIQSKLQAIQASWDDKLYSKLHFSMRIDEMSIPLILELKRPTSRRPKNAKDHLRQVLKHIRDATVQADDQALCLFSSLRYAGQDEVLLLAASGQWWTWRLCKRSEFQDYAFDPAMYASDRGSKQPMDFEAAGNDHGEDTLVRPLDVAAEAAELRRRLADEDRKTEGELLFDDLEQEMVPDHAFWLEDELRKAYHKIHPRRILQPSPDTGERYDLSTNLFDSTLPLDQSKWVKPMRLGSAASNTHMKWIKNYLSNYKEPGFWSQWTWLGWVDRVYQMLKSTGLRESGQTAAGTSQTGARAEVAVVGSGEGARASTGRKTGANMLAGAARTTSKRRGRAGPTA